MLTETQLQSKKAAILTYASTGLSFEKACLLAALPEEYIKVLQDDKDFQFSVRQGRAALEYSLVEQVVALGKKGGQLENTADARWLLERLDPDQWGKRTAVSGALGFVVPEEYDGI